MSVETRYSDMKVLDDTATDMTSAPAGTIKFDFSVRADDETMFTYFSIILLS